MNPESILALRDEQYRRDLQKIGSAIGYGNAQRILGELWDDMLEREYGAPRIRGRMGVTIDDTTSCRHANATVSVSTTTDQETRACPNCGHVWTTFPG